MTGAGSTVANNTVRQRISTARTFFAWALRSGHVTADPTIHTDHLRKQYPKVYGKRQAANPARFLTVDQVANLFDACRDRTWVGSRDQLAIRLGLLGLRAAEVTALTWANLDADTNHLNIIGKGRKAGTVAPGPNLVDMLTRWRTQYEKELGRPIDPTDPILCREILGTHGNRRINWGQPMAPRTFFGIVNARAKTANLGHVAPHDLRRTCASILHKAKTNDGGHLYDLLDIQQVMRHSDPATTQRSYIEQLDTETTDRAGRTLDF